MKDKKTFIIAELSANHNNDYNLAVDTIKAMADAGADAVKVQTYTADSLTLDVDNEYFGPRTEGLWKGMRPYQLFKEGSLPYEWHEKLKGVADDNGLQFFSTPFDLEGVDFLEGINVPFYKIASLEITHIPLIEYVASKGKPIIISTGVAEIEDISLAIETCRKVGNEDITLLKCTSNYPADVSDANLLTIPDMRDRFGVKIGVSDHTMGSTVPIVSVALGATVVEKHFILNRSLGGPDAAFSMEPDEFAAMVKGVREAEGSLGKISYEVSDKNKMRRRSLFVARDIKEGEVFTEKNIRSVRPGYGLPPKLLKEIIGKKAKVDLYRGQPLGFAHFQ
jgi:pseudaminic acid synthase